MERVTDYGQLRDRLRLVRRPALVAIEGFTGSGKSYLADAIARDLNAAVIHTDEYVTGDDESLPYPDRLDCSRIATSVSSFARHASLVLIDGICLRETLRRTDLRADLFIYVKRIAENGLWHDGFHLEDYKTNNAITENQEEPHRSDFAYHVFERPHEHADVIFERVEQHAEA